MESQYRDLESSFSQEGGRSSTDCRKKASAFVGLWCASSYNPFRRKKDALFALEFVFTSYKIFMKFYDGKSMSNKTVHGVRLRAYRAYREGCSEEAVSVVFALPWFEISRIKERGAR